MAEVGFAATVGQAVSSVLGAVSTNMSAEPKGSINFGQIAQDQNRFPGDSGSGVSVNLAPGSFWEQTAIDATRWDKRYPYQLLVLNALETGNYVFTGLWSYTLPIPPESLTIQTPFASSVQATLGGIVEEHNGAPFKILSIQANTGVMPVRESSAGSTVPQQVQSIAGGIFAGAIQAATQVASGLAAQAGVPQFNLMNETLLSVGQKGFSGRGTGYYQFRLLQAFLESYAELKKTHEGRSMRLAFASWKDQAIYIVTPISFEVRRSASDPLAYPYSLQLKAWRRLSPGALIGSPSALDNYQSKKNSPTVLQEVLNGIGLARGILEGARSVIGAVVADVDNLFEPIRQTELLISDALGVGLTLANLPSSIASLVASEASFYLSTIDRSAKDQFRVDSARGAAKNAVHAQVVDSLRKSVTKSAYPIYKTLGLPSYEVLAKIPVSNLKLSPQMYRAVQKEVDKTRALKKPDLERFRNQVQQFMVDYADAVGEGSTTYNDTYNRNGKSTTKTATDTDFTVMYAMNEVVQQLSRVSLPSPEESSIPLAVSAVAGLARKSGIAFQTPVSKFAVPFPYGATLETLSLQYLGDANRWMEIAALNGLTAPYIDEVGFELPLAVNGNGDHVVVEDSSDLHLGQTVTVHSLGASPARRIISRIEVVSTSMSVIYLDGEADMDRYKVSESASLHAYLPDTVNSQQQIYIPSASTVEDELTSKSIPGISDFSESIRRGGIDLLVSQSGDAAITTDGDWKYAIGLSNTIQRVRVAMETVRGSLPQHPSFGLGLQVGTSTSDLDAKGILEAARGMFAGDPDFTGVHFARVSKKGPGLTLNIGVGIAGRQELLPISFSG